MTSGVGFLHPFKLLCHRVVKEGGQRVIVARSVEQTTWLWVDESSYILLSNFSVVTVSHSRVPDTSRWVRYTRTSNSSWW